LAFLLVFGCGEGGASDPVGSPANQPSTPSTSDAGSAPVGGSATGLEAGGSAALPVTGGEPSLAGSAGTAAVTVGGADPNGCGPAAMPEPEPMLPPAPVAMDSAAQTTLKSGNFDDAATNVLTPSSAAGVKQTTRNGAALWQSTEPGAWLEYTVDAVESGSYSFVVMYYSAEPGGIATISVDDVKIGVSRFASKEVAGEYGGVPNCCARGHGVIANLGVGAHRVRVSVSPRSTPLEIYGLQINFAGQRLANAGKLHALPATSEPTSLPPDGVTDFYRMNYDAAKQAWPCQKSFCRVEYLVSPAAPGRYELSLHYEKIDQQCMGVGISLEDESTAVFRLAQAANVTTPVVLDLPCGVSRISIRDPNYVEGEFCSFGALFGAVELTRAP
jgi:hypothetical protein